MKAGSLFSPPGLVLVDLSDEVQVVAGLDFLTQTFFPRHDLLLSPDPPVEILVLHQFFTLNPLHVLLVPLDGRVHRLDH